MKSLQIFPSLLFLAFLASDARAAVTLTTLHSFTGPEGANPVGLLQGSDGNFYGTTEYGGSLAAGTNDEGKGYDRWLLAGNPRSTAVADRRYRTFETVSERFSRVTNSLPSP